MAKAEANPEETEVPEADADAQVDVEVADAPREDGEQAPEAEASEATGSGEGDPAGPDVAAEEDARTAEEEAEEIVDDLAETQAQLEDLNDRHLRLAAEFNNYRRRSEQERLESWSRAQADLVTRFLDVLDDLSRVANLDLSNATVETIMEGIDLVERKFLRVLEEAGVEVIDPAGEPFDPERMEAMMRVPTESEEEDETVAEVFAKGYTLDGILVRPARVSVKKLG